jgi:hypothetical protein
LLLRRAHSIAPGTSSCKKSSLAAGVELAGGAAAVGAGAAAGGAEWAGAGSGAREAGGGAGLQASATAISGHGAKRRIWPLTLAPSAHAFQPAVGDRRSA